MPARLSSMRVYADTSRDTLQLPVSSPEDRTDNIQPGLLTNSIHSPSSPKLHEHDNSSFMSASVCANAHAQPGSCRRHARGLFLNLYFHLIAFKSSSRALSSNYFFPLFQSPHCHRRLKIFCAPKSCLPDCNLSDDTIPFFSASFMVVPSDLLVPDYAH